MDGIEITADLYANVKSNKNVSPIILLFHQAGYSRGEYREIAPRLNKLGFTCIAIDQRSGNKVNGIINSTHLKAKANGLPTKYPDALQDLQSTLNYTIANYPNRKIIIWGSSYSSSLVFILANQNPELISGVLSFSPGEYFELDGKTIATFAKGVTCPVFITSAKNEHGSWEEIYTAVPNPNKHSFLPESKGFHGSKALWIEKPGNKEYWEAVITFLTSLN